MTKSPKDDHDAAMQWLKTAPEPEFVPSFDDIHTAPPMTGAQVLAVRKYLGLTQPAFGEILGVSGTTVNHWENEVRRPNGAIKTPSKGRRNAMHMFERCPALVELFTKKIKPIKPPRF